MTDSEAYMVGEPVPVGPRNGYQPKLDGWMGFARIFDNVWSGKRHALVGRWLGGMHRVQAPVARPETPPVLVRPQAAPAAPAPTGDADSADSACSTRA